MIVGCYFDAMLVNIDLWTSTDCVLLVASVAMDALLIIGEVFYEALYLKCKS